MKQFAAVLMAVCSLAIAQDHTHPPVVIGPPDTDTITPKDGIPDFVQNPTIRSVQSGNWHDPATWDLKRAPEAGDCPKVTEPHVVSFGGSADLQCLGVEGALIFRDEPSVLKSGTTLVYRPGKLHIGTGDAPLKSHVEFVIADKPIDFAKDPQQFGTGLIVFGESRMQGATKTGFLRLAQEAKAGDETLTFASAPLNWNPGDKLYLPDTAQYPVAYKVSTNPDVPITLKGEEVVIAGVSGNVVALASPLSWDHLAGRDDDGNMLLPHVMNRTRNVVVRSENPAGTRGHIMFTERALVTIRYTQFEALGRTTTAILNDAKLVNGVWQIGLNQRGRYPVHFHHLMGPRNPSNLGYQFYFVGNAVVDGRKWCVAVHNSHYGLIQGNVIYKCDGSGLVTEQGNEREIVIEDNYIAFIGKTIQSDYQPIYGGVRIPFTNMDFGWEGSCYFLFAVDFHFRRNVCANAAYTGVNVNARPAGFAANFPLVPNFRGADIAIATEWTNYAAPYRAGPPIRELAGNETYASTECVWVSFTGEGTVRDMRCWNVRQRAVYNARNGSIAYEGLRAHSDPAVSNRNYRANCGLCSSSGTYTSGGLRVVNPRISGFNYGMLLPGNNELQSGSLWPNVSPDVEVTGGRLKNNVNVMDASPHRAKKTTFTGTTFERNAWGAVRPVSLAPMITPTVPVDFAGTLESNTVNANIVVLSRLLATDYQAAGNNVEFFFPEQRPDYVMQRREYPTGTLSPRANCPTQGLTNQQCMAAHGVATLGRVATCTTIKSEARGFVCPIK